MAHRAAMDEDATLDSVPAPKKDTCFACWCTDRETGGGTRRKSIDAKALAVGASEELERKRVKENMGWGWGWGGASLRKNEEEDVTGK